MDKEYKMFHEEIIRAFKNRSFTLALVLGFFALGQGGSDYIFPLKFNSPEYLKLVPPFYNNVYDAVIWSQTGIFSLITPLIAVLPFSDSLAQDRVSGYLRFILSRTSFRRYFFSKIVACMLVGGLSVSLPILFFFGFMHLFFPRGINIDEHTARLITSPVALGPFGFTYHSQPDIYILSLVFLGFIGGAVYAILGLSISAITDNRYIALATPFPAYILAHFITAILLIPKWSPLSAFVPHWYIGIQWQHIGLSVIIASVVSIFLFSVSSLINKDR